MSVITETAALEEFCKRASKNKFITVDTEFIRDKTYWPRLCLVQIADDNEAVAIDTLAKEIDLAALFDLMNNTKVVKVFHAARQDIEIFLHLGSIVPHPLFDTQVAAMVCGFGESVGYDTLVAKLMKARIDKSMRFTDWSRRPLSRKQIDYALSDVTHLRGVYEKLSAKLEKNGRTHWLAEEMATLTDPATYRIEPEAAWKRLKTRIRRPHQLCILREIAAWREREAQERDVPRNRVLRDEALSEIAIHEPTSVADLKSLRGLSREQLGKQTAEAVIKVVEEARSLPEDDYPSVEARALPHERIGPSVDLLKVLLKLKCHQHDVAQKLVATVDDLEAIARDDNADVAALHGWRRKIFGKDALALKHGRLALTADGAKLKVIRTGKGR